MMNKIPTLKINFAASRKFDEIDYELKIKVREAIDAALEYENFPYHTSLSVTFCDEEYIRALNKQYRNKDKPTDVLSFPIFDSGIFPPELCRPVCELGDIVISIPRAAEQARELGHGLVREVAFLAVHSVLHLLGYDHERGEEDDRRQCEAQRDIIEKINFN